MVEEKKKKKATLGNILKFVTQKAAKRTATGIAKKAKKKRSTRTSQPTTTKTTQTTTTPLIKAEKTKGEEKEKGGFLKKAGKFLTAPLGFAAESTAKSIPLEEGEFSKKKALTLGAKVVGGAVGGAALGGGLAAGGAARAGSALGIGKLLGWGVTAGSTIVGADTMKVWLSSDNLIGTAAMSAKSTFSAIPFTPSIDKAQVDEAYNSSLEQMNFAKDRIEESMHYNPLMALIGKTFVKNADANIESLNREYQLALQQLENRDLKAEEEAARGSVSEFNLNKQNVENNFDEQSFQDTLAQMADEERAYWEQVRQEMDEEMFIEFWNQGRSSLGFGLLQTGGEKRPFDISEMEAIRRRIEERAQSTV